MATSNQELKMRLLVLEDKIEFVMKQFTLQKRTPQQVTLDGMPSFKVETISMLDLYRELKASGGQLVPMSEVEQDNG